MLRRVADRAGSVAVGEIPAEFGEAMDDDLGVPRAVAVVHERVRAANTAAAAGDWDAAATLAGQVRGMLAVLGLDPFEAPWTNSDGAADGRLVAATSALLNQFLSERTAARAERDFERADAIRNRLAAAGFAIEDTPDGPIWTLSGASRAGRPERGRRECGRPFGERGGRLDMAGNSQRRGAVRKTRVEEGRHRWLWRPGPERVAGQGSHALGGGSQGPSGRPQGECRVAGDGRRPRRRLWRQRWIEGCGRDEGDRWPRHPTDQGSARDGGRAQSGGGSPARRGAGDGPVRRAGNARRRSGDRGGADRRPPGDRPVGDLPARDGSADRQCAAPGSRARRAAVQLHRAAGPAGDRVGGR